MAITVNNIVSEYGAYYEKNAANMQRLKLAMMQPAEMLEIPGITHIVTDDTIFRMSNPFFSKVLQGFQKAFTQKGDAEFLANQINLRQMKIDFSLYPQDIEATWLGFLYNNNLNKKDMPIVRWLLENYLVPKGIEDKEMDAVYKGVYSAPTPGTANNPGNTIDGFHKLIQTAGAYNDSINKHGVNSVTGIGAMSDTDVFDQIEAFDTAINRMYKNRNIVIFVSPEMELAYCRKKRALKYYDATSDKDVVTRVDFSRHIVKGVAAMTGETGIFATPAENIVHVRRRDLSTSNMKLEELKREVYIMGDWWEGIGFGTNRMVWASAETITAA